MVPLGMGARSRKRRRRRGESARVLLLVASHVAAGRDLIDGLVDYAAVHGPWEFFDANRVGDGWDVLDREKDRIDGVVVGIGSHDPNQAERLGRCRRPVVINSADPAWGEFATVFSDDRAITRLAAEHFHDMGLRRLAFCAQVGRWYVPSRRRSFQCQAERLSCEFVDTLELPQHTSDVAGWLKRERRLARWVARLPQPVGILADNLDEARDLASVCLELDVPVPERVAILSIGVDRQRCRLASPTLSSIDPGMHAVGYQAGLLLERMMRGERVADEPVIVAPRGIDVADSTRAVVIEDDEIARAVRLIRERACDGVKVDDLLDALPLSRRKLERGLKAALGRTVHQELRRVRLERAQQLLAETDLGMPDIAARAGFASASDLCKIFKRQTGTTPGTFRARSHTGV
jgi:LacI family transcriptional regulator